MIGFHRRSSESFWGWEQESERSKRTGKESSAADGGNADSVNKEIELGTDSLCVI